MYSIICILKLEMPNVWLRANAKHKIITYKGPALIIISLMKNNSYLHSYKSFDDTNLVEPHYIVLGTCHILNHPLDESVLL